VFPSRKPAKALDLTLEAITARHGERTAHVVAMQFEYPRRTSEQSGAPASGTGRNGF
jgi:hypothetical protein